MTSNLAPPASGIEQLIEQLAQAVTQLTAAATAAETELKTYTPAEAGRLLGKTENWVVEAIQARRIPFTYIGKSPRLTAAHIRWVQEQGEVLPSKYARGRGRVRVAA